MPLVLLRLEVRHPVCGELISDSRLLCNEWERMLAYYPARMLWLWLADRVGSLFGERGVNTTQSVYHNIAVYQMTRSIDIT